MKRFAALMMAAVTVASVTLTHAFAASTNATFELSFGTSALETSGDDAGVSGQKLEPGKASLAVQTSDGSTWTFYNKKTLNPGDAGSVVAAAFAGAKAEMRTGGILYTAELNSTVVDSGNTNRLQATVYPAGKVPFSGVAASLLPASAGADGKLQFKNNTVTVPSFSAGTGGTNDNSDKTIDIEQVLYTDSSGRAVPLVENKSDLNGTGDGVRSGSDVYFLVNAPFDDDRYFKLRASKGSNSKNIDKIEVVSKHFSKELYRVYGGQQLSGGLTTGRHTFIKVPLKELYTDDEYKITFDLRVSLTSAGEDRYPDYKETSIRAEDVTAIWLKNKVDDGDGEYRVGEKGMMIKPLENDRNEIIWYNEAGDLARLNFFADSDVDAFYSKLSTKWNHADYASYFNDQDAFIFDFTGSPKLSSTSRADLEIYNPFLDEDGNETADPRSITIYQVVDGDLYDITDRWTYKENDDGYMVYSTRTRFLGTYIFAEKPVETDDDDWYDPDPLPPATEIPVLPGDEPGGKKPPNTGRYMH